MRASEGMWIAQSSTGTDMKVLDSRGCIQVPPEDPAYTLKRLSLSREDNKGFYYGLSNEGIWPLCHIAHTRPIFRSEDWQAYERANRRFADALLEEVGKEKSPMVLVQDGGEYITLASMVNVLDNMIHEERIPPVVAVFVPPVDRNYEYYLNADYERVLLEEILPFINESYSIRGK